MESRQQIWLRSGIWDTFFMLGGLWLIPLILVCSTLPESFLLISLVLTAVLWLSHRVATFFTIFCTSSYRTLIASEPLRFIVIPLLVVLLSIAFAVSPVPSSPLVRLQIMGTIFILFNSYHFGVQHFGVLTIYRIKGGQQIADSVRDREKLLCLTLGGVLVLFGQLLHGADVVRESLFAAAIPSHDISVLRWIDIAASIVAGGVTIRDEISAIPVSIPKVAYKIALTIQAVAAFVLPALPFLILWAVQHWLVSVGLALQMTSSSARTQTEPVAGRWWRVWNAINGVPILSAGILIGFSVVFTPILLLPTKVVSGATSGTEIPFLREWFIQHETATLILIGLNFGSVFCHFLYDRAVFRFSHPATRAASGKLLFSKGAR